MKPEPPCNKSCCGSSPRRGRRGDHPTVTRGFTQPAVSPDHVEAHAHHQAPSRNDLSPKGSLFLFVFLSRSGFSTLKAPFQQLLHVQASRACWRLSPERLLLLPINNISDAQATQSHCRKGQQESSSPREITFHNCPMAEAGLGCSQCSGPYQAWISLGIFG